MAKRVLVVEDDPKIREDLKMQLLLKGYEVFEANNGLTGLSLARNKKPHIILQDLLLSKVDGFRIARLLKFDERYKHIIMIAITQLSRDETREEAHKFGFDFYYTKPLDMQLLIDHIERLFSEMGDVT